MANIMSFRLKKFLNIKGRKYRISQVKRPTGEDGKECAGYHDHEKRKIVIARGMEKEDKLHTFLHELFHAYIFECGIREGLDSQLEEVVVDQLAKSIIDNFEIKWKN